jgi:hypothetical protein
MPGVARAGCRTPLASIQPATKRKQHLLIVVANQQPQNGPKIKHHHCPSTDPHQTNTTLVQQRVLRTDLKEKTTPLLCRCPATGVVIQFFQKCKWSRYEQHDNGTFPGQRIGKHVPGATGLFRTDGIESLVFSHPLHQFKISYLDSTLQSVYLQISSQSPLSVVKENNSEFILFSCPKPCTPELLST